MKTIRTAKESRLNYTSHGIKGKNGEVITSSQKSYAPAFYDFDAVGLEIKLRLIKYDRLCIIPHGCRVRNDSDLMTDYFVKDELKIPATSGVEFLAAAIGYKKYIEAMRKKGAKKEYYKREAELNDQKADALMLAEQIARGDINNGEQRIAERILKDKEQQKQARLEQNKKFAAELLKKGNSNEQTIEQSGDLVILRIIRKYRTFDGLSNWRPVTLESVIVINIKTGEREQVNDVPAIKANEFYNKWVAV